MNGIAGAEEIEDNTLDCMASPASKTFNESRQHRVRRLNVFSITGFAFAQSIFNVSIACLK